MCEFLVDGTYKCPKDAVYADSDFVYVTRNASNPITFLYNDPVFLIISMFVILIFISIIQLVLIISISFFKRKRLYNKMRTDFAKKLKIHLYKNEHKYDIVSPC